MIIQLTKHRWVTILVILPMLFASNIVFSQDLDYFITKSLEDNDISKQLPTLDSLKVLMKENSPKLKYDEAEAAYANANLGLARTQWLNYIYAEATYNYGMFDYLSSEQLAGLPTVSESLISTNTSRYTFGVSVKMPLSAIFNRRKNVKAQTALVDRAKYQKEVSIRELERNLISDYNEVLRAHRLMFVASTIVDTYKVQSMRAEEDYENGLIPLSEYTRLQQQLNQAFKEFEKNRADFLLSFMYLENTVGAKIKLTNTNLPAAN